MDVAHLRAFVAVAEAGSLTAALPRLHLSQPAVSLQLRQLQEEMGVRLFYRAARGVTLTPEGRRLLPLARRALQAFEEVRREAAAIRSTVAGELRLGTILDPELLRLGEVLKALMTRHPQVRTALSHGTSGDVLEGVRARALDVGFYIGMPAPDVFHAITLTRFDYRVVAPRGWEPRVTGRGWSEIAELPWIWTPPDSAHQRLLSAVFERAGVAPNKVAEADLEPSMLDLVKSGIGLALVRDTIALREAPLHGLVMVEGLAIPTELTFVALKERAQEPVVAAAFHAARAVFEVRAVR